MSDKVVSLNKEVEALKENLTNEKRKTLSTHKYNLY